MKEGLLLLVLLYSLSLLGQSNSEIDNTNSISVSEMDSNTSSDLALSFSPQYLITGGMRVDFDFPLTQKTWLTIAPTFYYVDNSSIWAPEYIDYVGVGAQINYRYFPSSKGMYTGFGLNYKYLSSEYTLSYDDDKEDAIFNTFGFDFTFGYQFLLAEQLFMDLYLGWGFRYSTEDSPEDKEYWSDYFLSLAYSGFIPVAGLRIGFEF